MALIVVFERVAMRKRGREGDYNVKVYVNRHPIATSFVKDHDRRRGWQGLVRKLGKKAGKTWYTDSEMEE